MKTRFAHALKGALLPTALLSSLVGLGACASKTIHKEDGITIVGGDYKPKPPPEPTRPSLANQPGAVVSTGNYIGATSVQEAIRTLLGTVNAPGRENWAAMPPVTPVTASASAPTASVKDSTASREAEGASRSVKAAPRARVAVSTLAAPHTVAEPEKEVAKPVSSAPIRPFNGFDPSQRRLPGFDPTQH